uniref:Uncharacterized protein n=1 Tax=Anopheles dirus TaxID=7168 RepID=A0A182NY01_9DIPT
MCVYLYHPSPFGCWCVVESVLQRSVKKTRPSMV